MTSPTVATTPTAVSVLAGVVAARQVQDQSAVDILVGAVQWADLHPGVDADWIASFAPELTADELPLAGEGAPLVDVRCLAELGAALNRSTESARMLIGDGLELRHRLPRLWQATLSLRVPVWQAREVAQSARQLSLECVEFIDGQLAIMPKLTGNRVHRLVQAAIAAHMPELAEKQRQEEADRRHVEIYPSNSTAGLASLFGTLDLADAIDLDTALNHRAAELGRLGVDGSLKVRRSIALGDLGRLHQSTLDLQPPPHRREAEEPDCREAEEAHVREASGATRTSGSTDQAEAGAFSKPGLKVPGRQAVFYLHLSEAALSGAAAVCWLGTETDGAAHLVDAPVLAGQIREWCGRADITVTVKPVIDVNQTISAPGYRIPDRIHESLRLRDRHCVFPHCRRRRVDADHRIPWPRGQTSTDNLGLLCRYHHRAKTFTAWRYRTLRPGVYLWTSPMGRRYLRDQLGTYQLE